MIAPDITALLNEHRSLAQVRFRIPLVQSDPNDYLNDIDHLAELLCEGDPSSADDVTTAIKNAHDQLDADNADTGFDLAKRDIGHWQGHAADDFAAYLSNAQGAVHHYRDVLHDFAQVSGGLAGMLHEIPNSVRDLVERAITAQQQQESQQGWEVGFTLVAGITAGIASVITAGGVVWLVLGLSAASIAGSEASAVISTDGPGETAASLRDGLQTLLNEVVDKRENFRGAIDQLDQHITEAAYNTQLKDVEPQPPLIITAPNFQPGNFFPDDEPPGVQDGVSTAPLVKQNQDTTNSTMTTRLAGG